MKRFRTQRFLRIHLDAWAAIAFLLGYFLVQPLVFGYRLAVPF